MAGEFEIENLKFEVGQYEKNESSIEASRAIAVGFGLGRRLKPTLLRSDTKNESVF